MSDLAAAIRTIPHYPKPGIMFRDITTLLDDAGFPPRHRRIGAALSGAKIDKIAGIEARGFILGGAVAHQLRPASCRSARRQAAAHQGSTTIRWNTASTRSRSRGWAIAGER